MSDISMHDCLNSIENIMYKIKLETIEKEILRISSLFGKVEKYEFQVRFYATAFTIFNKLKNVQDDQHLELFRQWLKLNEKFAGICN